MTSKGRHQMRVELGLFSLALSSLLVSSRMFSTAQYRFENDWASITHYVPLGHHLGIVRLPSVKPFW